MSLFLCEIINILLLVTALSIDAFVAGFAYGVDKIRIPFVSMAIIGGLSAISLMVSLLPGRGILSELPPGFARFISIALLLVVGFLKLFDGTIKCIIRRKESVKKQLDFHVFDLRFLLTIYADPNKADADQGGMLSAKEACSLGIALSIDSIAAGVGAGIAEVPIMIPVLLAFVMGAAAIGTGMLLGNRVAAKYSLDISWIGGLLLILLSVLKMRQ